MSLSTWVRVLGPCLSAIPVVSSAARRDFEHVLRRNPRHPDALNNKAQSEMSQGLLKDSQESFFKLLHSGQRVWTWSSALL